MLTHQEIDRRLLGMVRLCVEKIDAEPALLAKVNANATRITDPFLRAAWLRFLALPWEQQKARLLAPGEAGDQLRQNAPFGGLLSNAERFRFFERARAVS